MASSAASDSAAAAAPAPPAGAGAGAGAVESDGSGVRPSEGTMDALTGIQQQLVTLAKCVADSLEATSRHGRTAATVIDTHVGTLFGL